MRYIIDSWYCFYLFSENYVNSNSTFKPAWWLRNPHLQTLWSKFFRWNIKNLPLTRERIELPDGDFVDLDYTENKGQPMVLILHGLEGSISSTYAKGMLQAIHRSGWQGVFMNFRGCSGESNRLSRAYHSGATADVAYVVDLLCKREPGLSIAAIGFSLGANVLLKWLGETGAQNPLCAAVAVSTPFDLYQSVKRISKGFSRIYQRHFLNALCLKMENKFRISPASFPFLDFPQMQSLYDFDNKITAPLHGFVDAIDYYTKSSSRQFLHAIQVPTLLLQAKDDPFMTLNALPSPSELSPMVKLELSEQGGHIGFITGKLPGFPRYWLDERIPLFLTPFLTK